MSTEEDLQRASVHANERVAAIKLRSQTNQALAEYARAASEVLVTDSKRVLDAESKLLSLGFKFQE